MIPKGGISLRQLRNYVMEYGDVLQGLTTRDVVLMIKERTNDRQCSYLDWLVAVGRGSDVAAANVFVSHAWDGLFLDLADALELAFGDSPSARFWIDIFVIHQSGEKSILAEDEAEDHLDAFEDLFRRMDRVIMVLTPFDRPHSLWRIWCLYEFSLALRDDIPITIAISPTQRRKFLEFLNEGGNFEQLYKVHAELADATETSDKRRLYSRMRQDLGGFHGFNERATDYLREWLTKASRKAFDGLAKDVRAGGELQCNLGIMLTAQSKFEAAAQMLEECAKKRNVKAVRALGKLYRRQGRTDRAMSACAALLELGVRSSGPWGALAAVAFADAGDTHLGVGIFNDALVAHLKSLDIAQVGGTGGRLGQPVLLCKIAKSLFHLGRYAESLAHLQEAHQAHKSARLGQSARSHSAEAAQPAADPHAGAGGEGGPGGGHDLAETLYDLGQVYQRLGRQSEALGMFEEALQLIAGEVGLKEVVEETTTAAEAGGGWGDLSLGGTCLSIGLFYQRLGCYPESLVYLEAAHRARVVGLGPHHADVGRICSGMGHVYRDAGRLAEALERHEEALRVWRAGTGGGDHPGVAAVLADLAAIQAQLGRLDQALLRGGEAKEMFARTLTRKHARTVQAERFFEVLSRPAAAAAVVRHSRPPPRTSKRAAATGLRERMEEMARLVNSAGAALREQGRFAEALARHEEALAIRRAALGPEHPEVAAALADAAEAYRCQGEAQAALAKGIEAHEILERTLGPDHARTIRVSRLINELSPPPGTEVLTWMQRPTALGPTAKHAMLRRWLWQRHTRILRNATAGIHCLQT